MKNWHCLIIDEMHESIVPLLEQSGFIAHYHPKAQKEEITSLLKDKQVLILRSKTEVNQLLLQNANALKFVLRAGAGIEKVDLEYLKNSKIGLLNAPEGNRDALGEHAVALLLSVLNNIVKSNAEVGNMVWDREGNRGVELMRKTVGLIGYGNMGFAFASRLKAFGCTILAYDKYKKGFSDAYVEETSMERIKAEADIISIHTPLTEETNQLINRDFFNSLHKPVFFINTARGEIVNLDALVEALKSNKVIGAGLDVLSNEKLHQFSEEEKKRHLYLSEHQNVVMTPHVGGWSFESYKRINEVLVKKLKNRISEMENI